MSEINPSMCGGGGDPIFVKLSTYLPPDRNITTLTVSPNGIFETLFRDPGILKLVRRRLWPTGENMRPQPDIGYQMQDISLIELTRSDKLSPIE